MIRAFVGTGMGAAATTLPDPLALAACSAYYVLVASTPALLAIASNPATGSGCHVMKKAMPIPRFPASSLCFDDIVRPLIPVGIPTTYVARSSSHDM